MPRKARGRIGPQVHGLNIYKPEYCEMLIKHMSQGYSLASFAADINSSRDVLYDWIDKIPEFADAHKTGYAKALKFFETMLISEARGLKPKELKAAGAERASLGAIIFALKTRFHKEYKEPKTVLEVSGEIEVKHQVEELKGQIKNLLDDVMNEREVIEVKELESTKRGLIEERKSIIED